MDHWYQGFQKYLSRSGRYDDNTLITNRDEISIWYHRINDLLSRKQHISLEEVAENGLLLAFVEAEYQTPALCRAAISQNPMALAYVAQQTPELCFDAVRAHIEALACVRDQTPELCLFAVSRSGLALRYIREQTPALCRAAIACHFWAFLYVREPTQELLDLTKFTT